MLETLGLRLPCLAEMVKGNALFVDNIILHKSFIENNEEGTEAAAATVASGLHGAARKPPINFEADDPFSFF